jgi:hypothetical protein
MKRWYFLLIAFAAAQITLSLLSIFTLESLADASYKRGRQVQIVAHALKTNVDPGRQIELIDSTRPAHSKADSYSAILILMQILICLITCASSATAIVVFKKKRCTCELPKNKP